MRFDSQTIVVTGASEGIGLAICQGLAAEGAHVVMLARRAEGLEKAAAAIRDAGGRAEAVALNVGDTAAFAAAIKAAHERTGRLDGLVNNAAYTFQASLLDTPVEKWRRAFTVNVEAPFVGMQAAVEIMRAKGTGAIVNISSVSGVRARKGGLAYSSTKAALNHMGSVAAVEAAEYGVRINTVIPGPTLTESFVAAMSKGQSGTGALPPATTVPLGRFGTPEDVAKAVLFLLSDDASFITGETLRVEGGGYWTR